MINENTPQQDPSKPTKENGEQNLGSSDSDTEVNPGEIGNETEVDLDNQENDTYPGTPPPERH